MRFFDAASLRAEARAVAEEEFARLHPSPAFVIERFVAPPATRPQEGAPGWSETWTDPDEPVLDAPRTSLHSNARVFWIEGDSARAYSIGRDSPCEIVVPHPRISRRHAVIRPAAARERWLVEECGSANGTVLNGRALRRDEQAPLEDGDRINLAGVAILRPFFVPGNLYRLLREADRSLESPSVARERITERAPRREAPLGRRRTDTETARRKRAEKRLVSLLENLSGYGVIVADTSGRFVLCNKVGERILGAGSADASLGAWAGRCGFFLPDTTTPFPPDELPLVRAILGYQSDNVEAFVRNENVPEGVWISMTGRPIKDEEGLLSGGAIFFHDVTHMKRLEEQRRQEQRMEAVGRLAGGVAHDFNNLLTVMNGYAELMLKTTAAADPQRERIEEIKKAGERAAALTHQLLAFSRKQVLQPRVLDLNALVKDLSTMLRRLLPENIDFALVLAADLGHVKIDPGQLEQVIVNLVINARDAMRRGGRLTIETRNATHDELESALRGEVPPGSYVSLAITDTGCGMDRETLSRIFEPFFTTKEKGKGTGLGLSMVFGIVRQSGGYITVTSEVGMGTTFHAYLPLVREDIAPATLGTGQWALPSRGSETVLLVEDTEMLRRLARTILEMESYVVLEAADGAEAMRVSEEYRGTIHLLVTDVIMPGLSGRQLQERLAAERPAMRVLFMSGYTDDALSLEGVLDPETAFIQKPFTPASLARQVRAVLDGASRA